MSILEAIILGIIQGLTEFLPISSSGHLVLFQKLFGLTEGTFTFDIMVHLGTLVAVAVIFWKDIVYMIKRPFDRLTLLVIVGTIPTVIIGLAFKDYFKALFESGSSLGIEFIVTGAIIWFAENMRRGHKKIDQVTYGDAILIGILQGAAILPAISRSGLTIAGALFRGIERETAARYSFLLSIPAILGGVVLDGKDVFEQGLGNISLTPLLIGTVVSAIAGYLAIKTMIALIQRGSLKVFSWYVWVLGIGIIMAQLLGKF
ncbi:MAG: undecaprenyl-diphosphate phosphatase [Clostridia bacterium]|nr:undecaprenyl-diphosphate phosphatase [Clostridia bacterium]